jgi:hypothetical protein
MTLSAKVREKGNEDEKTIMVEQRGLSMEEMAGRI